MNQRNKLIVGLTTLVLSTTLAFGSIASAAGAGEGNDNGRPHLTTEQKCEHSDEITAKLTERQQQIAERTAQLQTRRAEAQAAGDTAKVERIDRRLARLGNISTRLQQRATRFAGWVAENCAD